MCLFQRIFVNDYRTFKSVVSKNARQIHSDFKWQKLYYDRIIRNWNEFIRVKYYIQNNPKKWFLDEKKKNQNKIVGL